MKINFEIEIEDERPTPINIANALIKHPRLTDIDKLEEVAQYLLVYVSFHNRHIAEDEPEAGIK